MFIWEIKHLGGCHLGNYPWEIAAWEKSFGKVRNITGEGCHSHNHIPPGKKCCFSGI